MGGQLFCEIKNHKAVGAELATQLDLADKLFRPGQFVRADAGMQRDFVVDPSDLAPNALGEIGVLALVIHRANEIEIAGFDPSPPILTEAAPGALPIPKHRSRDFYARLDLARFLADGAHKPGDLLPPPIAELVCVFSGIESRAARIRKVRFWKRSRSTTSSGQSAGRLGSSLKPSAPSS